MSGGKTPATQLVIALPSSLLKKPSMVFSTSQFKRRSRVSRAITYTMPIVRRSRASLRAAAFGLLSPATWFSNCSHFQWLAAIENDGTSLYRTQPVEKQSFSTGC
jgi:hypothetical protein